MVTQEGGNVRVCAIRGNFDDAQTGVKNVFAACKGKDLHGAVLSSANSINIGRLAPQTWSLNARPSEQYRLLAKRYAYKFTLLPCNNESEAIRNGRRLCNKR